MRAGDITKAVGRAVGDGPILVVEDYDGTIAPIVDDPARALPHPRALSLLRTLSSAAHVAIVSGRPAAFVLEQIGDLRHHVDVVGMYGRQRARGDLVITDPAAERDRAAIATALQRAREQLAPRGVRVEDKEGLSVGLHVRELALSDPSAMEVALQWANAAATELGLHYETGRQVVELTGAAPFDKGRVLQQLVDAEQPRAVLVVGDDKGDIPAFAKVRELRASGLAAYSIAISSTELAEEVRLAADTVVRSIDDGLDAIARLTRTLTRDSIAR